MSFSADVKNELCMISCDSDCCQRAEAYGLLYFGRSFSKYEISIMTDYEFVAERYRLAIYNLIQAEPTVTVSKSKKYTVSVDNYDDRMELLYELGYTGNEASMQLLTTNIENECCFGAFLRGVFLSCGIVNDPKKNYHLELCAGFKSKARQLNEMFSNFSAVPKLSSRNGLYIVYFKDSSHIEDILTVMGAQQSVMELIGEKILKDVRNNVNRKVNCDNANIRKTCEAARTQIEAINKLKKNGKFDDLPQDLKNLATMRVDNPEMTLSELGANMTPPLSRSSVNWKLKKLMELAN